MQTQTPSTSTCSSMYQTPHSRWTALSHRAPATHSSFIYGVKSTKIYCRPTCPARLARRANIIFYDTADQAQRDGFRPCKRCKPDTAGFAGEREEVVTKVIALLRIQKNDRMMRRGVKELAKEVGVSTSYLCRVFKKTMGITIGSYMTEFEKEASGNETETEISIQPLERFMPGVVVAGTDLYTPPILANGPAVPIDESEGGLREGVGNLQDALDFNLDEWFWFDEFWNQGSTTTSV
ncbi:hypothetical protein BO94DRAFT_537033 [Aspergillus sclerotioniger CBS 115572]|uniref:HTH araC/xylS-type domain-containing protein n=1 Tax=Aspergillus sclerotioniger CBS 115572 TaxID=1450535 RepID=A0A317W2Q0_9EURO|nr:hypothetical protein BO94DRAFT_537033 [Aspergillus sclerotioniger CBS 115572]PWY80874.1 hypothetical protein BO94DRAFT_537033 [Aspergillus sclerotioniger CBS 115572]